jgi:hypothetical protein
MNGWLLAAVVVVLALRIGVAIRRDRMKRRDRHG